MKKRSLKQKIRHRFRQWRDLFFKLLKTGLTPVKLANAVTLGFICGLFPVIGTHTVIGLGLGFILRLNQLAVYLGLWVSFPFYVLLLLPMLRVGETVSGASPLDWDSFYAKFKTMGDSYEQFLRVLSDYTVSFVHMLLGWVVLSIATGVVVYVITLYLARKYYELTRNEQESEPQEQNENRP